MLQATEQTPSRKKSNADGNVKFTISLSAKSAEALNDLKELTDAATDSEVFRNALRIHMMLVRAQMDGKQLYVRDVKEGDPPLMVPVTLFAPD